MGYAMLHHHTSKLPSYYTVIKFEIRFEGTMTAKEPKSYAKRLEKLIYVSVCRVRPDLQHSLRLAATYSDQASSS